jgi:hypothetical protein
MVIFLVLLLIIRGLPALLWYRHDLSRIEQLQLGFFTATTLLTAHDVTHGPGQPMPPTSSSAASGPHDPGAYL